MLYIEKLKISVYMYMEKWSDVIYREIKDIGAHVYEETEQCYRQRS